MIRVEEPLFSPLYPLAACCGLLFASYGKLLLLQGSWLGYLLLVVGVCLGVASSIRSLYTVGRTRVIESDGISLYHFSKFKRKLRWADLTYVEYRSLWTFGLVNEGEHRRYQLYRTYYFHFYRDYWPQGSIRLNSEREVLGFWADVLASEPALASKLTISHEAGRDACAKRLAVLGDDLDLLSVNRYLTEKQLIANKKPSWKLWLYPFLLVFSLLAGVCLLIPIVS